MLLKLLHSGQVHSAQGCDICLLKQLGGEWDQKLALSLTSFLPIPSYLSQEAFPPAVCMWGIDLFSYLLAFLGTSSLAGNGED